MIEEDKIAELFHRVQNAQKELSEAKQILDLFLDERHLTTSDVERRARNLATTREGRKRVIEGVFNGEDMVGPDGKRYTIPANYASKSKLVEGDILKLTILEDGSFVYKQIGPIKRTRKVGILTGRDDRKDFAVLADGKTYRVLNASVSYYKGQAGDEVTIIVPEDGNSDWAAIENLVATKDVDVEEAVPEAMRNWKTTPSTWEEETPSQPLAAEQEREKVLISNEPHEPWKP